MKPTLILFTMFFIFSTPSWAKTKQPKYHPENSFEESDAIHLKKIKQEEDLRKKLIMRVTRPVTFEKKIKYNDFDVYLIRSGTLQNEIKMTSEWKTAFLNYCNSGAYTVLQSSLCNKVDPQEFVKNVISSEISKKCETTPCLIFFGTGNDLDKRDAIEFNTKFFGENGQTKYKINRLVRPNLPLQPDSDFVFIIYPDIDAEQKEKITIQVGDQEF